MRVKKVLLAGSAAVGKTSLSRRLKFGSFETDYKSTIGVQLHELQIELDDCVMPVVLWDTDGNFGEAIFDAVYAKGSAAAILVCDVTRPETIENMINIARKFSEVFPGRPSICVINKIDLLEPSSLMLDEISQHTDHIALCSAKMGTGVHEAIKELALQIMQRDSL